MVTPIFRAFTNVKSIGAPGARRGAGVLWSTASRTPAPYGYDAGPRVKRSQDQTDDVSPARSPRHHPRPGGNVAAVRVSLGGAERATALCRRLPGRQSVRRGPAFRARAPR